MPDYVVYICGPMSGYVRQNYDMFDKCAGRCRELHQNWHVISPADLDRDTGYDPNQEPTAEELSAFFRADISCITACDALVLLPNWLQSQGSRTEVDVALKCGLTFYLYDPIFGNSLTEVTRVIIEVMISNWDERAQRIADDEERIVNPTTGGAKGQKLARYGLIPPGPLDALARHFGHGARKYEARNWEKGTAWHLNFEALQRHVWAWWAGEEIDEDTGSHHLTAVAWHAFTLLEFTKTHPELDDRSK